MATSTSTDLLSYWLTVLFYVGSAGAGYLITYTPLRHGEYRTSTSHDLGIGPILYMECRYPHIFEDEQLGAHHLTAPIPQIFLGGSIILPTTPFPVLYSGKA